MAFTAGLRFGLSPALMDKGVKMPPAGRRTAHKRREVAGEYRDKGGHVGGHTGQKARPRKAQGGRWWYSRFFRRLPDNHNGKHKDK